MKQNVLNDDWSVEYDEAYGGGYVWSHEACPSEHYQGVTSESRLAGSADSQGYVAEVVTLTCHDCLEVSIFTDLCYVGNDEY